MSCLASCSLLHDGVASYKSALQACGWPGCCPLLRHVLDMACIMYRLSLGSSKSGDRQLGSIASLGTSLEAKPLARRERQASSACNPGEELLLPASILGRSCKAGKGDRPAHTRVAILLLVVSALHSSCQVFPLLRTTSSPDISKPRLRCSFAL